MGHDPTPLTTHTGPDWSVTDWPALHRFAQALREHEGAERVLLFGSRARGQQHAASDYDVIIISPRYADIPLLRRGQGLRALWYAVGGDGPMELVCVSPTEFAADLRQPSLLQAVLPEAVDLL
jgi:Nucleotidyltransferase domain